MERFSLGPLFKRYFRSMRAPGAESLASSVRLMLFGLPVAAGLGAALAVSQGLRLNNGISQAAAAIGLLAGAMLTCFVFLTNLRVKVEESEKYQYRKELQRLIGSTVVATLYGAVVALTTALALVLVGTLPVLREPPVRLFTVGVLSAMLAHLTVVIATVFRRLYGMYDSVYGADFGPTLGVVAGEGRHSRASRVS